MLRHIIFLKQGIAAITQAIVLPVHQSSHNATACALLKCLSHVHTTLAVLLFEPNGVRASHSWLQSFLHVAAELPGGQQHKVAEG